MYGRVHWIDMGANQNGKHLTLQITPMQLKKSIAGPCELHGRPELGMGTKTLNMYLSVLISAISLSCYMTHLTWFIYDLT